MTIRMTYSGALDKQALFQDFQFMAAVPHVVTNVKAGTIIFSDPANAKNYVRLDIDAFTATSTEVTGGWVTDVEFASNGTHVLDFTGLHAAATGLNTAFLNGFSGGYSFVTENMIGAVIATGDKYDNILEVGKGAGTASVKAGAGNDLIEIWHAKNVVIDGGTGTDTIEFDSFAGVSPAGGKAVVDLLKGTGTNPFGGTLTIKNIENVVSMWTGPSVLAGDNNANLLYGGRNADLLLGRGGDDTIHIQLTTSSAARAIRADGGTGTDTLIADLTDTVAAPNTGTGDTLRFHNRLDLEHQNLNTGTFHGGTFTNFEVFQSIGFLNHDIFEFAGTNAAETVQSSGANDVISGRGGNDVLQGSGGADTLIGGLGADHFQYLALSDSTAAAAGRDTIRDFSHAQHDKIDLSPMFPRQNFSGAYDYIGTKAFDGHSSEVRFSYVGSNTLVQVDDDGDRHADMAILLLGHVNLLKTDFML